MTTRTKSFRERILNDEMDFFNLAYDEDMKGFKVTLCDDDPKLVPQLIGYCKKYSAMSWFEISKVIKNRNSPDCFICFKDNTITDEASAKALINHSYKYVKKYADCTNCLPFVTTNVDGTFVFDLEAIAGQPNSFQVTSEVVCLKNIESALRAVCDRVKSIPFHLLLMPPDERELHLIFNSNDSPPIVTVEQAKDKLKALFSSFMKFEGSFPRYGRIKKQVRAFIQQSKRKGHNPLKSSQPPCKKQKILSSSSSSDDKKLDVRQTAHTVLSFLDSRQTGQSDVTANLSDERSEPMIGRLEPKGTSDAPFDSSFAPSFF